MMIWNMEYGKRSPTRCVFGGLMYKMLGDSFFYKTPYTNKIKTVKPNITLIPDFWGVNIYLTQILTEKPLVLILKD